ncbi:MAG TPA: hypothetical protein VF042_09505 [Gemmatimonadaceae bacterium]
MSDNRESVRLSDWLALREPPPPPELAAHIAHFAGDTECDRAQIPTSLVRVAAKILASLGDGRESANDLLAADALVTYAVEAAAEQCADLDTFSAESAALLSRIGGQP